MNKQIVISGDLISYSQIGEGERVVIFLHGWRSQKEIWQSIINQLARQPLPNPPQTWGGKYGMYALDLPGFGQSPAPRRPWTMGDYAEFVKGFIEKLGLQNVIVVGHSFGGRVAIKLAAKYPPALEKLVLVDAAGFVMESSKKNVYGTLAKIAKPFFKPAFMQGLRKKIYQRIGAEDYVATPESQKTFVNIVGEDLSADMENIRCQTLIVWGENDQETPLSFGQKMHSLIPGSKFVILPQAEHFSFLNKTEEFTTELVKFISQ